MTFNKHSAADMKAYLGYAVEFEKYVYLWEKALNKANDELRRLNQEKRRLQTQKTNSEAAYSTVVTRTQNIADNYDKDTNAEKAKLRRCNIIFIALFCAIIFPGIFAAMLNNSLAIGVIVVFGFYSAILLVFYLGCRERYTKRLKEIKKRKKQVTSQDHIEYEQRKNTSNRQDAENKLAVIIRQEPQMNEQAMEISNNLREARTILNKIYSLNILPVKYRNFVAVATLYEYLVTERCTAIQGHGGIYDTYEHDLQQKLIIENLQNINASLSRIEANQQFLYSELQKANRTLSTINSSLISIDKSNQEIAKNTAISAAANQQTAAATRYLAWSAWANGY